MSIDQTVLVIGATQGTGFETVTQLLKDDYSVRIFARNEKKAKSKFGDRAEIYVGDLQHTTNMLEAVKNVDHIIFTAGVARRPHKEGFVIKTEFDGIKRILSAAKEAGFQGKFLFLSSIGVVNSSLQSNMLNFAKGNALKWRFAMEREIRQSGLPYTIIRAGYLMNSKRGLSSVEFTQTEYPLYLRYRIGRKDVAKIFVNALETDDANGKTFDAVWGRNSEKFNTREKFSRLKTDS